MLLCPPTDHDAFRVPRPLLLFFIQSSTVDSGRNKALHGLRARVQKSTNKRLPSIQLMSSCIYLQMHLLNDLCNCVEVSLRCILNTLWTHFFFVSDSDPQQKSRNQFDSVPLILLFMFECHPIEECLARDQQDLVDAGHEEESVPE